MDAQSTFYSQAGKMAQRTQLLIYRNNDNGSQANIVLNFSRSLVLITDIFRTLTVLEMLPKKIIITKSSPIALSHPNFTVGNQEDFSFILQSTMYIHKAMYL